jgi:Spy/CpxP family protein refolding chaperone
MWKPTLLIFSLVHLVVSPLWAQEPSEGKPPAPLSMPITGLGRQTPERLLKMPAVQKDIKLSPAQLKQLKALQEKATQAYKENNEKSQALLAQLNENSDPEEVQALRQQSRLSMREISAQVDQANLALLDRNQRERLNQLRLQLEGPLAFIDPPLQERLNLSPEQLDQIGEVIVQGREQLSQIRERGQQTLSRGFLPKSEDIPAGSKEAKPARKPSLKNEDVPPRPEEVKTPKAQDGRTVRMIDPSKIDGLRSSLNDLSKQADQNRGAMILRIEKILTKRQRATYQKLLGAPFDVTWK